MSVSDDAGPVDELTGMAGPLRSREVFLDTDAYRRLGFDLNKPSMSTLLRHVREDRVQLHLTDITSSEIRRQIEAATQTAIEQVKAARNTMQKWRKRAPKALGKPKPPTMPIDAEAVAREANANFRTTLRPFLQHAASERPGTDIFRAYFQREAPFDGQDGKSIKEFPDAFVIAALDDWCFAENTAMYVVTGDKAMQRAAAARERLIPVEALDELLQTIAVEHSPDVLLTVEVLIEQPEFERQLSMACDNRIDDLGVIYSGYLHEGEASDPQRAGDPVVANWTVISANDDDKAYGIIIEFDVDLLVQIQFEDVSTAAYDREDGVFIGSEPSTTEVENNIRLRMFIQLDELCSITRAEMLTIEVVVGDEQETYK